MSSSADAIICYGVDLGDCPWEHVPQEKIDALGEDFYECDDNDEILAYLLRGLKPFIWDSTRSEKCSEYSKFVKDILTDHGVEIVYHCHHECTMYIIALKGSVTRAYQGGAEAFSPAKIVRDASNLGSTEGLHKALIALGKPDAEPQWLLTSM